MPLSPLAYDDAAAAMPHFITPAFHDDATLMLPLRLRCHASIRRHDDDTLIYCAFYATRFISTLIITMLCFISFLSFFFFRFFSLSFFQLYFDYAAATPDVSSFIIYRLRRFSR